MFRCIECSLVRCEAEGHRCIECTENIITLLRSQYPGWPGADLEKAQKWIAAGGKVKYRPHDDTTTISRPGSSE